MTYLGHIEPRAEIIGADGVHVGTVDHVDGNSIALAESGDDGAVRHISGDVVVGVEDGAVRLNVNAEDVVVFEPEDTSYRS